MSYFERLRALAKERDTMLCVGLDPDPERIPGDAAGALRHCREVVRQTEEHVCCYKPNSAFWEQYGPDGWKALLGLRSEERRVGKECRFLRSLCTIYGKTVKLMVLALSCLGINCKD